MLVNVTGCDCDCVCDCDYFIKILYFIVMLSVFSIYYSEVYGIILYNTSSNHKNYPRSVCSYSYEACKRDSSEDRRDLLRSILANKYILFSRT